jgi:hypothetical protein
MQRNGSSPLHAARLAGLCAVLIMAAPAGASATPAETVLHSFMGGSSDGAFPSGGLIGDSSGNLYGVTAKGGAVAICVGI